MIPRASIAADGVPYKGVDVSSWQDAIDWSKMKAAGIDFAILRCYSKKTDKRFAEYYDGATAQGIWVGSYVYMYATTAEGAAAEAQGAVAALGGRALDFPLFLDVEDNSLTGLGKAALTDLMITELEIFAAAGYRVGVYSSESYSKNYFDRSRLSSYDFWCAKWSMHASGNDSEPFLIEDQDPFERNPGCHIWQCSNGGDGKVYGTTSKFVDLDYCYYDYTGAGRSIYPYVSPDPDDYAIPKRNIDYASGKTTVGADVAWVQTVLCRLGFTLDVDGSFGPASAAAVKSYQKSRGITSDGIVGSTTRGKLIADWNAMKQSLLKITVDPMNGQKDLVPSFHREGDVLMPPSNLSLDGSFLYGWRAFRANDGAWLTEDGFVQTDRSASAVIPSGRPVATGSGWLAGGKTDITLFADWKEIIPGDADGDGDVTMKDVLIMRREVAGLGGDGRMIMRLADADGDGVVSAKDILFARKVIAGLI